MVGTATPGDCRDMGQQLAAAAALFQLRGDLEWVCPVQPRMDTRPTKRHPPKSYNQHSSFPAILCNLLQAAGIQAAGVARQVIKTAIYKNLKTKEFNDRRTTTETETTS